MNTLACFFINTILNDTSSNEKNHLSLFIIYYRITGILRSGKNINNGGSRYKTTQLTGSITT
jgi:hypothetical protein